MAKIVAVRKNDNDALSNFKLDNGKELDFQQCYNAISTGEVEGAIATTGKSGVNVIRSVGDGNESNNLSNLPRF